jgi:hypothetical protein
VPEQLGALGDRGDIEHGAEVLDMLRGLTSLELVLTYEQLA